VFYGVPSSERFAQRSPGRFEYAIDGQRVVYASGLTMDSRGAVVSLKLTLGAPTRGIESGFCSTDSKSVIRRRQRAQLFDNDFRSTRGVAASMLAANLASVQAAGIEWMELATCACPSNSGRH